MARKDSLLLKELRQKRPFPSAADEAAVAILRTADRIKRRLSAVVAPEGITLQQYNVLRILAGSHPDPLPGRGDGQGHGRAPEGVRAVP